ncbi:hypothetical protein ECZU51_61640 [Escherichia coli]|nr:hypothetical protein ECZU51_61640 [Escherichia coli]
MRAVRVEELLRSGDIWVQGSRQFKDFEDYGTAEKFTSLKQSSNCRWPWPPTANNICMSG